MKWFITDMDGTFLNDKKEVAPNAKDVIVKLQDKGSKFIIATGRPDIAVKHYYYNLGMNDVVISNNGSLIRNLSTGEIVYQKSFKIEEIEKIYSMFKELNDDEIEFHVYTLNYIYCNHLSFSMARMKKLEADMPEELKTPMYIHDDIIGEIKKNKEDCQKIMMIAKDHDKVVNFFNEVSKVLEVDGTFSATDFFDIMPKGCNKGTAIEKLAEYYNSPIEDCVVFGDNFNDKEMFDVAGWSVCPNNAKEEIQKMFKDLKKNVEIYLKENNFPKDLNVNFLIEGITLFPDSYVCISIETKREIKTKTAKIEEVYKAFQKKIKFLIYIKIFLKKK